MSLAKILLCLDTDPQPSVFDAVVAVDAGVDQLLRHGGVTPDDVREPGLRGDVHARAGRSQEHGRVHRRQSDVAAGEKLLAKVRECFFGPMRVSVMLDSNGANTTAAAAVLLREKHVPLAGTTVTVLAATGSVGRRVVRLLAREGASVRVASRQLGRAQEVCDDVRAVVPDATLEAWETRDDESLRVVARRMLASSLRPVHRGRAVAGEACAGKRSRSKLAIDLNAVPPTGIGGHSAAGQSGRARRRRFATARSASAARR